MRIVLMDGSPKGNNSASAHYLAALGDLLGGGHDILWSDARSGDGAALGSELLSADALVVAFPLYVDGIPSHLLAWLESLERQLRSCPASAMVYVLCNAGFFEARQTRLALEMMKVWCFKSGLIWGRAMGIGAGGMAMAAPVGHGPFAKLGREFQSLAGLIEKRESAHDCFVEPDFPRVLYKAMAHWGWRWQARKNGLKASDLKRQHSYTPPSRP